MWMRTGRRRLARIGMSWWVLSGFVGGCGGGTSSPDASMAEADASSGDAGEDGGDASVPWPEMPDCEEALDGIADLASVPAVGEVRAGVIDLEEELIGGESADGRLGDFKLMNRLASFVVQAPRPGDYYVPYGGGVVDADLTRAPGEPGHDVIDDLSTSLFLRPFRAEEVCIVADGSDGGPAIVRSVGVEDRVPIVSGTGLPMRRFDARMVQDFVLEPDSPAIEIVTRVAVPRPNRVPVGDFLLLSDDGVDPFAVGEGFDRSTLFREGVREMIGTVGEASHFALGLFPASPPWEVDPVVASLLALFGGNDVTMSLPGVSMPIAPGELVEYRRYLAVGPDVDTLNRVRFEKQGIEAHPVVGVVRSAAEPVEGARVHALRAEDGAWVSMARTMADGSFEMWLPAGEYDLVPTGRDVGAFVETGSLALPTSPFARGHGTGDAVRVHVGSSAPGAPVSLSLPPIGWLRVSLVDESGAPLAGRVLVLDPEDAAPPALRPELDERRAMPSAERVAWTLSGRLELPVPAGSYRVVGGRGFRYELASQDVSVSAGAVSDVQLVLQRAYAVSGWFEGDFHVHGGPSVHGEIPRAERVAVAAAEGLDFFVGTDHDWVVDYRPFVAPLGLEGALRVFVGNEISAFPKVHFNAYPLQVLQDESNGGASPWWDIRDICMLWDDARSKGAEIIQVNHATSRGSYFQWVEFDWTTGTPGRPERWCDTFDVMESVNGGVDEALLLAYVGVLGTGKRVTPVGVSDSHWRLPPIGQARTFLRSSADGVAGFDETELVRALRSGATVVSTGPFVALEVENGAGASAGPGETLHVPAGAVSMSVRVLAPSWMPVERVSVVASWRCPDASGECSPVHVWGGTDPLVPDGAVWLDTTLDLDVPGDGWLFVRADSEADMAPFYPGVTPFAHTAAVRLRVGP